MQHFPIKTIEQALNVSPSASPERISDINLWDQVYRGEAEQNTRQDNPVVSLQIGKQVCNTVARNVVVGLESEIQGNEPFNGDWQRFVKKRVYAAINAACAYGEVIFYPEPYDYGRKIEVKFTDARSFFPVRYNTLEEMESVIFIDKAMQGEDWYTLYTVYDWQDGTQYIWRKAYKSTALWDFKNPVPLDSIEAWKHLEDEYDHPTSRPWFAELTAPNREALFNSAIDMIREAEEQFARGTVENVLGETMIFVPPGTLRDVGPKFPANPEKSQVILDMPKGKERMFLQYSGDNKGVEFHNPALRNESFHFWLNVILKQNENIIGMSRGHLSDAEQLQMTATEIKDGQAAFVVTVETFRDILRDVLPKLAVIISEVAVAFGFYGPEHELTINFGDFVTTEAERLAKFQEEWRAVQAALGAGLIKPEVAAAWLTENHPSLFKVSDDAIKKAKEQLPEPLDDEFEEE